MHLKVDRGLLTSVALPLGAISVPVDRATAGVSKTSYGGQPRAPVVQELAISMEGAGGSGCVSYITGSVPHRLELPAFYTMLT